MPTLSTARCFKEGRFSPRKNWKRPTDHRSCFCRTLHGSAQFLSGLRPDDRLIPVLSLAFYYGEDPWDTHLDLHSLLGLYRPEYQILKSYISNYQIQAIHSRKIPHPEYYQTDLQLTFGMLKYTKEKERLQEYLQNHREYFSAVDEDTYYALGTLLGSEKELKAIQPTEGEGKMNMCKALQDLKAEGRTEGLAAGQAEATQKVNRLIQLLMERSRIEDVGRMAVDEDYQKELFKEFGL